MLENLSIFSRNNVLSCIYPVVMFTLLSIPLGIGVALASGFPPISGLLASVFGGIVVSVLSASPITIKGPAGGLSTILLGSVISLGQGDLMLGYQYTLVVILLASLFLIVARLLRLGGLADAFPSSTIHGMLAALGLTLAIQQFHFMLGVDPGLGNNVFYFSRILSTIENLHPKESLVGLVTLFILIVHAQSKVSWITKLPGMLLALVVAIVCVWLWICTTRTRMWPMCPNLA